MLSLRKNQKGQVAIFVALIFQVIFILFALLINVGLLVHHKINLQQSTDLAAYYGAMKQAEILNAASHVNFQIRQTWKLLAWRYRVLGTFGVIRSSDSTQSQIPFPLAVDHLNNLSRYAQENDTSNCPVSPTGVSGGNIRDIPFMCYGHTGFSDWQMGQTPSNYQETFCRADCSHLYGAATILKDINGIGGAASSHTTGDVNSVNQILAQANANLEQACRKIGPASVMLFAKFYQGYLNESQNRMKFLKMLMAMLSMTEDQQLDLDGARIKDGVYNTFLNNLTEANYSSSKDSTNKQTFEVMNSVSPTYGAACSYSPTAATPSEYGDAKLFAEVNFQFLQYFALLCNRKTNQNEFRISSIYNSSGSDINQELKDQIGNDQTADTIRSIITQNRWNHTLGIEKNPWCPVYYGVKATSEPVIPFLPIGKIKLHAISLAKPFGGSLGPRYYNEWPNILDHSTGSGNVKTDNVLPYRNIQNSPISSAGENVLTIGKNFLINYSNYVGDNKGLSDPKIIALYHDMLVNRVVADGDANSGDATSSQKTPEPNAGNLKSMPAVWPAFKDWNDINKSMYQVNSGYDPLAYDTTNNKNSFSRDIELSVVAPNQFDLTYYSIEPDFYNTYLKRFETHPNLLATLQGASGVGGDLRLPYDYGYRSPILTGTNSNAFSVKNQLEVVQKVFRKNRSYNSNALNFSFSSPPHAQNLEAAADKYMTYIPTKQSSFLTSWTLKDLVSDDYSAVVTEKGNSSVTAMPFGECNDEDELVPELQNYGSVANDEEKRPPVPGNCVSGGRTGYSVKITNSNALRGRQGAIGNGGSGGSATIKNPPDDFLSF